QRDATEALGLAGAQDEEHLRTVERQQRAGDAGAGPELLEGGDVLADPLRHLSTGEADVAEVDDRAVPVALERRDHQVAVVRVPPQGVVARQLGREGAALLAHASTSAT